MQFNTLTEFLAMGGYGLYVWLGFGLGLLSVALLWFESWWVKKKLLSQVLIEQQRQLRIKRASVQQVSS